MNPYPNPAHRNAAWALITVITATLAVTSCARGSQEPEIIYAAQRGESIEAIAGAEKLDEMRQLILALRMALANTVPQLRAAREAAYRPRPRCAFVVTTEVPDATQTCKNNDEFYRKQTGLYETAILLRERMDKGQLVPDADLAGLDVRFVEP